MADEEMDTTTDTGMGGSDMGSDMNDEDAAGDVGGGVDQTGAAPEEGE